MLTVPSVAPSQIEEGLEAAYWEKRLYGASLKHREQESLPYSLGLGLRMEQEMQRLLNRMYGEDPEDATRALNLWKAVWYLDTGEYEYRVRQKLNLKLAVVISALVNKNLQAIPDLLVKIILEFPNIVGSDRTSQVIWGMSKEQLNAYIKESQQNEAA
ncbi:MAG: hypothetical protein ACOCXQ_00760 [Patescibacteria group bacterium]